MIKKIINSCIFTLIVLMVFSWTAFAALPEPTDHFYVNDFANVINQEDENLMVHYGNLLNQASGAQVVLVTVDFTDGLAIDDYAYELINQWEVGSAERDNGLLILLSIGDDDYWAVQGTGLEDTLDSGTIGDILYDYLETDFAAADYSAGATKAYGAFVEELGGTWSSTINGTANTASNYVADQAGVISQNVINYINTTSAQTANRVNGGLHVVTVNDTEGQSMEAYTDNLFNSMGLEGQDMLLVLSIADDNYWILQGDNIEQVFTVNTLDDILYYYMEPDFAAKNYSQGVEKTAAAIYEQYQAVTVNQPNTGNTGGQFSANQPPQGAQSTFGLGGFFMFVFIVLILILLISSRRRGYYRRTYGIPYNPFSRRRVRRYGPGGYWGRYGPPPLGGGFWYHGRWNTSPQPKPNRGGSGRPPSGGGFGSGGGSSSTGGTGRKSSGSFWGSSRGGGGSSRGGGAGRSSSGGGLFGGSSLGKSPFGGGSGRSGFGGGGRSFGGGGSSRGGGAGRRK